MVSDPITSWQTDGEKVEAATDSIFNVFISSDSVEQIKITPSYMKTSKYFYIYVTDPDLCRYGSTTRFQTPCCLHLKLHPLIFRELCAEQSLKSCSFHLIINAAGPCFLTRFLTTSETLVDTKERLEIPWWSSG